MNSTEVITADARHAPMVDQTSLILARIASAIPQLPHTDDPRFPDRADALRRTSPRWLPAWQPSSTLATTISPQLRRAVRAVYHRLLNPGLDSGSVA